MKKAILILSIIAYATGVFAQYQTCSMKSTVKTLRIRYANDDGFSHSPKRPYLILEHNGIIDGFDDGNSLEISFDEMSHDVKHYTYSLIHLNADWNESDLNSYEFVDGFTTKDIDNYNHSLNTQQAYTHYWFTFPNEDMQIKASGNYALKIYEDGNRENVVAYACFSVIAPQVTVNAVCRSNTDIETSGRYQQLDIDVDIPGTENKPYEYFIVVRQNDRRDNMVFAPKPNYIQSQKLSYRNNRDLIFEGGNEYRHFDTYSIYFSGTNVDRIHFDHTDYHAFLEPDKCWGIGSKHSGNTTTDVTGIPYVHEYDTDGQFIINAERTDDDDFEAEYMWVHWVLLKDEPWFDGTVYVGGDLFNNNFTLQNRMMYDNDAHCYYLNAYLKQGAYDYQYYFVPKQKNVTLQLTEGSHWQTENVYTIYVYSHPFGARADELVGFQQIYSSSSM